MPEEAVLDKPTVVNDSFDGSDKAPEYKKVDAPIVANKIDDTVIKKDEPIINDIDVPKEWLKKEFDIEDPAILKAEREELKNIKANPPKAEEIKFNDEQSKQIHELLREGKPENKKIVREFLQTQEQLEEISSLQVNKDNATDIIKLQIKLKNPQLTLQDVEFEYKQNYGTPKEPVQKATEDDADFEERHNEWKEQVESVERRREIAAKMAQPELSKYKSELKLPELSKIEPAQKPPKPEELETAKQNAEKFLQNADVAVKSFEGFNVTYKDNDVEVQSTYTLSDEEKTSVLGKIKLLAENDYNSNAVFAERWVNADNSFNFNQMAKDLATLETQDKSSQKFVSDTVAKAKLGFIKEKHNIDLVVDSKGELQLEDKDGQKKNEDAIWQ